MQPTDDHHFIAAPAASYMIDGDVDLARMVWRLSVEGWRPLVIDRHTAGDKQRLLDAFAIGLGFPDWFGHNWDALVDLLRQWAGYQPIAIIIADMGGADVVADPVGDELATVATLTDIIDELVVDGVEVKLGIVPTH